MVGNGAEDLNESYQQFTYSEEAWCKRSQAKPQVKPSKPAQPNSNSAKRRKPVLQARRLSLINCTEPVPQGD